MNRSLRICLGLALGTTLAQAVAANPQLDRELAAIVSNPRMQLASLSVLAIADGKVQYQQQFGSRVIGGDPATPQTMYRIASISKMITTLGLMKLVEEGKLSLDADVGQYLGYPLRNPSFPEQPVTLRTLLSHTSSLRDEAGYSLPPGVALKDVLAGKAGAWANNAGPGKFFTYCNLNWGVIGTIMEKVSGERFDRLMKRLLLDPMGLHGGYNPSEFTRDELANLATLYRKRTTDTEVWDASGPWIAQVDDTSQRPPSPPPGMDRYVIGANATPFSPTGGLRISAQDMGAVMLMLINGGRHQGRQILQPRTIDLMLARQWTFNGTNGDTSNGLFNAWGLGNQHFPDIPGTGMQVVEDGEFEGIGHLGEAYGLMSVFVVNLHKKQGMVVLVGGTSSDPAQHKGSYSSMARFEEQILTSLYRHAILDQRNK